MNVRGQSILTGVGMIRYLSEIISDHLRIWAERDRGCG